MDRLLEIEEKSVRQTEESIDRFKAFAKVQVKNRVEIYHKSRRRLELTALRYAK